MTETCHIDGNNLRLSPKASREIKLLPQAEVCHLYELHAPIEICVNAEDKGSIGNGLHELGHGNLVRRKEHDGGDASGSTVG